jgi:hypothetical protein
VGAEAAVKAITDGRQAAQLAGGGGVDEEVADGLEVPGRGPGDRGLTGAGEGVAGRTPGAWAALPGEAAACFQPGGDVGAGTATAEMVAAGSLIRMVRPGCSDSVASTM